MTTARAVWSQIQSSDFRVMRRVNRWPAPRWFRIFMVMSTRLGDGWLWYALGVILLFLGGEARYRAIGSAAIAAGLSIALFAALKRICHRIRPFEIEPHCWASVLPPDKFSFPSGHSITAFSIAISLGFFYPDLLWLLVAEAACIAASRIILGMHFLSDVLAGSALGVLLGYCCVHFLAYV